LYAVAALSSSYKGQQRTRGFTLVELLVVFAIMALLAALTPLAYDRFKASSEYRDTVRTMMGQLRLARTKALTEGREIRFALDMRQRSYGVDGAVPKALPPSLDVRATVASTETSQNVASAFCPRAEPPAEASKSSEPLVRALGCEWTGFPAASPKRHCFRDPAHAPPRRLHHS
jgi:general secretion pathway protein H